MVYEKQEKKEEPEVQNTLTLKYGEKKSVPNLKDMIMNTKANRKLISKIDKRGTIFHLCYAFTIA